MATDTGGNQKVDFKWGNIPMQPDTSRGVALDKTKGDHIRAQYAYNGFPDDWDGGVKVPNVVGMTVANATTALTNVGLVLGTVTGAGASILTQNKTALSIHTLGTVVNLTK
jgi:hypothetical protein